MATRGKVVCRFFEQHKRSMKTAPAARRKVRSKHEIHRGGRAIGRSVMKIDFAAPVIAYCLILLLLGCSAVSVLAQEAAPSTPEIASAQKPEKVLTNNGPIEIADEATGVQQIDSATTSGASAAPPPAHKSTALERLFNRLPAPTSPVTPASSTPVPSTQLQSTSGSGLILPANGAIPTQTTPGTVDQVREEGSSTSVLSRPVETGRTPSLFRDKSPMPGTSLVPPVPALPKEESTSIEDSTSLPGSGVVVPTKSSTVLTPSSVPSLPATRSELTTRPAPPPIHSTGHVLPQELLLPNGLRVVLLEEHSFPVVSCLVWYKVGSRNETPGLTGLSHLVEHLLFQNIGGFKKNEFGASIVANGGQFNGFTSEDFTAFYSTVAPSRLDLVLRGEAERMRSAKFTHADVQAEVGGLVREFDQEAREPITVLNREVHAIAFQQHPYRNPPGGWRSDAEHLTYEDARAFYDRYFYPDNASLVLVGDFKKEVILPLVKKYFLTLPKSPAPIPGLRVAEKMRPFERRITMKYGGKKESLIVAYPAPALSDADAPAMTVLEKLLNGQLSGRLRKQLVDSRICSSTQSVFEIKKDPSVFILNLNASGGTPLQKVLDTSDSLVNQLRSQLVSDAELSRAKKQAEFEFFSETDGPYLAGFHLGYFETLMNWQMAYAWPEKLRSVNAVDLQRVARQYLSNDFRVVGQLVSSSSSQSQSIKPVAPAANGDKTILQKHAPAQASCPSSTLRWPKRFRYLRLAGYKQSDLAIAPPEATPTSSSTKTASANKDKQSDSSKKSTSVSSSTTAKPANKQIAENQPPVLKRPVVQVSVSQKSSTAEKSSTDKNASSQSSKTNTLGSTTKTVTTTSTTKQNQTNPSNKTSATVSTTKTESATPGNKTSTTVSTTKTESVASGSKTSTTVSTVKTEQTAPSNKTNSTVPTTKTVSTTKTESAVTNTKTTTGVSIPTQTTRPRAVESPVQTRPATTTARPEGPHAATIGSMSYKSLPNGLEVVVIESHLNPMVQVVGSMRAGSVFETADKRGLSSLTALAMSYGRGTRQQILTEQDDIGLPPQAMIKFESGLEEINFQSRCLSKDFSSQLARLVSCLREPHFQDADVEKAKSELLTGISQSEDAVAAKVERALLRSVIPSTSPYYPADPTEKAKSISTLKPSDVRDYYNNHVTANTTAIVIAGDVQTKQVFATLEQALGSWNVKRDIAKPPVLPTNRLGSKSSLPLKDTTQSLVCLGRLIAAEDNSDKTWSDLLIADCALTNHPIFSRLNQRLESEPGLAASFRADTLKAHLTPLSEAIIWSLYLPVDSGSSSSSVASIQTELKRYSKAGLTAQELIEAKRYLLGSIPVNRMSNLEALGKFYLEGLLQRREPEPFSKVATAIRSASLEAVNKFILSGFKPDQAALVVAGNRQMIKQLHPVRAEAAPATEAQ